MFKFFKEKLQGFFGKKPEEEKVEKAKKTKPEKAKEKKKVEKIKVEKKAKVEEKKGKLMLKETAGVLSKTKPEKAKAKEKIKVEEVKIEEKEKKVKGFVIPEEIEEAKPEEVKVEKEAKVEVEKEAKAEVKKGKLMLKETAGVLSKTKPKNIEIPTQKDFIPQVQKQKPKIGQKPDISQENKQEVEYIIEQAEEKAEEIKEPKQADENEGFFSRFKKKFTTTKLDQEIFNEFFEKLEMLLLENNVALAVVDKIRDDMEKKLVNIEVKKDQLENEIKSSLKESILEILIPPFNLIDKIKKKENGPFVILFFGINGSGKTTTIAKIANMLAENKLSSVFAAADTFRAASIEQLMKHGETLGIKVIHQTYGSDPAAVAYDAISYAKAHQIKVVLIDTAGRMHTKSDLMREMEKIIRVTQPDLKIFVAESITGNDATEQAKIFNETANIDATILTKADVDEKGGTAISIGYVTGKPILFLGTGQKYTDLQKFSPDEIIVNLGLD